MSVHVMTWDYPSHRVAICAGHRENIDEVDVDDDVVSRVIAGITEAIETARADLWRVEDQASFDGFPDPPNAPDRWRLLVHERGYFAQEKVAGVFRHEDKWCWFEGSCDTTGWGCQMTFDWGYSASSGDAEGRVSERMREG